MSVTLIGVYSYDSITGNYRVGDDAALPFSGLGSLAVNDGDLLEIGASAAGEEGGLFIGAASGADGTVTVTGTNSTISVQGDGDQEAGAVIQVGKDGTGGLTIEAGGRVEVRDQSTAPMVDEDTNGAETIVVGRGSSGAGTLSAHAGMLSIVGGAAGMQIGRDGATGTVTFANGSVLEVAGTTGGEFSISELRIGNQNSANGSLSFDNSQGSLASHADGAANVKVGLNTGTGTFSLANGSTFTVDGGTQGAGVVAGTSGGQGALTIAASTLDIASDTGAARLGLGEGSGGGSANTTLANATINIDGATSAGLHLGDGDSTWSVLSATASTVTIVSTFGEAELVFGKGQDAYAAAIFMPDSEVSMKALQSAAITVGAEGAAGAVSLLNSDLAVEAGDRIDFQIGTGVGELANASNGTVTIDGDLAGIRLQAAGDDTGGAQIEARIGVDGGRAALSLWNGATFEIIDNSVSPILEEDYAGADGMVVGSGEGSEGTVLVDHASLSVVGGAPELGIGRYGATGVVIFQNSAQFVMTSVTDNDPDADYPTSEAGLQIGREAGSHGTLTFDSGSIGILTSHDGADVYATIGRQGGTGELNLLGGSVLTFNSDGGYGVALVGRQEGQGFLTIDDATFDLTGAGAGLLIGQQGGDGTLALSNDAVLNTVATADAFLDIGRDLGSSGQVAVEGSLVHIESSAAGYAGMAVGLHGGVGSIRLESDSHLEIKAADGTAYLDVGGIESTGTIDLRSGSTIDMTGEFVSFNLGIRGGVGLATIAGSTVNLGGDGVDPAEEASIVIGGDGAFDSWTDGVGKMVLRQGSVINFNTTLRSNFNVGGGEGSVGSLQMSGGSIVDLDAGNIGTEGVFKVGSRGAATATAILDGAGTQVRGADFVAVGYIPSGEFSVAGGSAVLTILNGARLSVDDGGIMIVGPGGAIGGYEGSIEGDIDIVGSAKVDLRDGRFGSFNVEGDVHLAGIGNVVHLDVGSGSNDTLNVIGNITSTATAQYSLNLNVLGGFKFAAGETRTLVTMWDGAGSTRPNVTVSGQHSDFAFYCGQLENRPGDNVFKALNNGALGGVGVLDFGSGTFAANLAYDATANNGVAKGGQFNVNGGRAYNIDQFLGTNLNDVFGITGTASRSFTLDGRGGNDMLTAGAGSDLLIGGDGNDMLNGGAGSDTMRGGTGNDAYYVDAAGDIVDESVSGSAGTDIVNATVSFNLANTAAAKGSIENLTLLGTSAINGTGNALNNIITGNAANNILTGALGTDTLIGGAGNDIFVLENGTDNLSDSAGVDTITSTITRTLASYATVENLTLLGTAVINGTGNALNNIITGNAANNILTGALGTDTLIGGAGNDTFVLENGTDTVSDSAGVDTITSTITRTLASYATVENLTLLGTAVINGTGNGLANTITGNPAANILNGGLGRDTLSGGLGNDTFVFNTAPSSSANRDTIVGFTNASGNNDIFHLENAIFSRLAAGALSATNFKLGAAAGDANDYVVYNKTKGIVYYDADGSGNGAAIEIAHLSNFAVLTVADFFVT